MEETAVQEISPQEFLRMQEQAIQRVKQMQKRSTTSEVKPSTKPTEPDEDDVKIYQKLTSQNIDTNIKQPSNEQYKKENPTKAATQKPTSGDTIKITLPPKQAKKQIQSSPLSAFLSMDNDMALILPLILLLGKEGADDILLLALLYILS